MTDTSFGKANKFGIMENTGYFRAVNLAYRKQINIDSGVFDKVLARVKSPVYATVNYAYYHPYKVALGISVIIAFPLITAYFLTPAYTGLIKTTVASTYASMVAGSNDLYSTAVANPIFSSLVSAAIVVTVGALIYMNYSKANQIGEARKLLEVEKPETNLEKIKEVFKVSQEKKATSSVVV